MMEDSGQRSKRRDGCPVKSVALSLREFHGVKMNRMIPAGWDGKGKVSVGYGVFEKKRLR